MGLEYTGAVVGRWLHYGEYEAQLDRTLASLDMCKQAYAENSYEIIRIDHIREGVMFFANALAECWRMGILSQSVPVYNLGIVDCPATPCGAGCPHGVTGKPNDENASGGE